MKLEDIEESWSKDSVIDETNLGRESLNIPKLHHKYYKIYIKEKLTLKKYEYEYNQLKNDRYEFYNGRLDDETLEQRGWLEEFKQFNLKVLKTEIGRYLEADKVLADFALKVAYQKEKVDYLLSIISAINFRNGVIKNAIEWAKFTNGGF